MFNSRFCLFYIFNNARRFVMDFITSYSKRSKYFQYLLPKQSNKLQLMCFLNVSYNPIVDISYYNLKTVKHVFNNTLSFKSGFLNISNAKILQIVYLAAIVLSAPYLFFKVINNNNLNCVK